MLRSSGKPKPTNQSGRDAGADSRMPDVTTDAAYWDEQAASFDEDPDHGLSVPATRAAWAQLLLGHTPPVPARVVDLGCGTGTLSVLLAEAGHDVTGVDYAPRMLEAARAKASAAGIRATFLL